MWTAWRLASAGRPAVMLAKGSLADSASACALGGIAAALGPGDSPELHAGDTLAAADGLADRAAIEILTTDAPARIRDLEALGAVFDRDRNGALELGLEGAHRVPRILHAGGDRTGATLVDCLISATRDHPLIEVRKHTEVVRLLREGDRVIGVMVLGSDGGTYPLLGPAVVLATGGVGQLYAVTTNPPSATGDGWTLALDAGALLTDLEFLQFHPTALNVPGANPAPLISEAVRGAGAFLVDREGQRFMPTLDARAELAPRHLVARAVAEADAAGGAWLDARRVPAFARRFPSTALLLARFGLQPSRDLIPVTPAMHYAMGGVRTDLDGRTSRPGLWAVGEVARTGAHGANRLASNSLTEALVFADRAARALAAEPRTRVALLRPEAASEYIASEADAGCEGVRAEMRRVMTTYVGVLRSAASLSAARGALAALASHTPHAAWRTHNQLRLARLIAEAALQRRESRGGHTRTDFPRRSALPS